MGQCSFQRETPAGAMSVVRPELIISEGVVAVSVSEVVIRDGEAVGRWRIYLRVAEGISGRERIRDFRFET